MSAQKGRDAVRPPQTHLETRSAAITRPKRRPRRIPPRRHRPKPPQARHADPNANADLSNLRRRAAHEHGRDRRSPPPQYFKTDFFNGIAPRRPFPDGKWAGAPHRRRFRFPTKFVVDWSLDGREMVEVAVSRQMFVDIP